MKIAILTTRLDKPSYRFRIGQFIPSLEAAGAACRPFRIPPPGPGRWRLFRRLREFDIVILQKKVLRLADRAALRRAARRLVYDVDDAVMFRDAGGRAGLCPKRRRRFRAMVRTSDLVLAGNDYLCRWAADHARRAVCFPTVVDTDRYTPGERPPSPPVVIGWSGSRPTNPYLNLVLPVLGRLAGRHPIALKVVSDTSDGIDASLAGPLPISFSAWSAATELRDLRGFHVGIMPLPDNGWARGKCALKALLYMACGVPAVCSAVGAAADIITDGTDGLLAASADEWADRLGRLIADEGLRARLAAAGRETVVARHSVAAHAPVLLDLLREVRGERGGP
ncbi:MAG: glycosyltransferase family 4 protein [bacterium]|nr:glycosyltransferase family 4 protein [bacterium]